MTPEQKKEFQRQIKHNFNQYDLEEYSEVERNIYNRVIETLGLQKGVINTFIVDQKVQSLTKRNQEIEDVLSNDELVEKYFDEHADEKPDWKEQKEKIDSLSQKLNEEERENQRLKEDFEAKKKEYDDTYAKPFDVPLNDPNRDMIERWKRGLDEDEKKLQGETDDIAKFQKDAEEGQKKLDRMAEAFKQKGELEKLEEKKKEYKELHSRYLKYGDEYEEDLDNFVEELPEDTKEYFKTLRKVEHDKEEAEYWEDSRKELIDTIESNRKNYDKMVLQAKDRVYQDIKFRFDGASSLYRASLNKMEEYKKDISNYQSQKKSTVKTGLRLEKANNSRLISDIHTFNEIEKSTLGNPIVDKNRVMSSVKKVKEAYDMYYTSHSVIGRFFKFLGFTSAAKDYNDFKQIKKCFTDAVGDKVNAKELDDYIEGRKKDDLTVAGEVIEEAQDAPANENERVQVEINVNDNEKANEPKKEIEAEQNGLEKDNEVEERFYQ